MSLKQILGNIGCTALSTIAPPFGTMAAGVLRNSLGLEKNATDEQVKEAIHNATPEQLMQLKQAEHDFKVKLKQMDVDIYKIDQEDRKDARDFHTKTQSSMPQILSIIIITGFLAVIGCTFFFGLPDGDNNVLMTLFGVIGAATTQVISYYFGSSKGSSDKNLFLHNAKKD